LKPDQYHSVYFLGIGGIGMSALARWFNHHGVKVYGYDRVRSNLCEQLELEGMDLHYEEDPARLPAGRSVDNMLVVYTPAVPRDHKEKLQLIAEGYQPKKRSEVLGMISREFFTVAVAGTHGKTTTSCLIAHILKEAGLDITAFLGGISQDLNSNFVANNTKDAIAVVEADEFDRSFLTLHPNLAIITNADADHLDIYGDRTHLVDSFKAFINKLAEDGTLFINEKFYDELADKQKNNKSYGINRGQFFAHSITIVDGFFHFDFQGEEKSFHGLKLGIPGFHNIENATAAIAVAVALNIPEDNIRKSLASFRGIKRRFEFILSSDVIFIDDYAHHPTEISAFIKSTKALFPDKKLTVIFQPHLYSRTRDFAEGFAESLSLADKVILLEIYPARESPIPGVTSEIIFKNITAEKVLVSKDDLPDELDNHEIEVLATVGAGDIDTLVPKIKKKLTYVS
jgi:UDP-N-acetylmuramate--alanine ligase